MAGCMYCSCPLFQYPYHPYHRLLAVVEGCATTFSCCLKLESEDVKHARTLDRAAEEDRKARLEAQRKLQQKTHNAALLGRATSLQEPRPPTPVKLATPSSDEAPSASEPTVSRTPSHKSTTSRTSRRSMFGNLFRNSRRALSFHTPRQPKRNELAAVVQEDADVALTVGFWLCCEGCIMRGAL